METDAGQKNMDCPRFKGLGARRSCRALGRDRGQGGGLRRARRRAGPSGPRADSGEAVPPRHRPSPGFEHRPDGGQDVGDADRGPVARDGHVTGRRAC